MPVLKSRRKMMVSPRVGEPHPLDFQASILLPLLTNMRPSLPSFFFFFGLFVFSKATLVAYGGSHARGLIGAVAAGGI